VARSPAMTLITLTSLSMADCLAWGSGYMPPRRQDYTDSKLFLTDAQAYWRDFYAAMEADAGVDARSVLLAGALPHPFEVGSDDYSSACTAAKWA